MACRVPPAVPQGEAGLLARGKDVQITPLHEITVARRSIPGALPRIETRRSDVTASDLDTVIIEEYPALGPHAVTPGSNALVRESSLLWRIEHNTHGRTAFSGDVAYHEKIAVVEADVQRQDLRINRNARSNIDMLV